MIDLEKLLQPISEQKPAGDDLRLVTGDLSFDNIEEMKREVDSAFDPGGQSKTADWKGVARECERLLVERTKDLEVAAWLTQAAARLEGFVGASMGLRLCRELVERFWDHLHPGWDEGEIVLAIRARPLSWLGTSQDFLGSVKRIPLTAAVGEEPRSWFDYEQSRRVDEAATHANQAAFQELVDAGFITGQQWQASLGATPSDRLEATRQDIATCQEELARLRAVCDEKFGNEAPYLLDFDNLLGDCHDYLQRFQAGQAGWQGSAAGASEEGGMAVPSGASPAASGSGAVMAGPITTREQAYQQLRNVADYLRRTEPHSPVALLVERAVKWGNMSFEDLFADVVKNYEVRNQVREVLGLPPVEHD
jgi:type VI secretion system protein ImpA